QADLLTRLHRRPGGGLLYVGLRHGCSPLMERSARTTSHPPRSWASPGGRARRTTGPGPVLRNEDAAGPRPRASGVPCGQRTGVKSRAPMYSGRRTGAANGSTAVFSTLLKTMKTLLRG